MPRLMVDLMRLLCLRSGCCRLWGCGPDLEQHAQPMLEIKGLNAGMRDVAVLAHVISHAQQRGEDFASPQVLARYGDWRRFDNASLAMATDLFNRLDASCGSERPNPQIAKSILAPPHHISTFDGFAGKSALLASDDQNLLRSLHHFLSGAATQRNRISWAKRLENCEHLRFGCAIIPFAITAEQFQQLIDGFFCFAACIQCLRQIKSSSVFRLPRQFKLGMRSFQLGGLTDFRRGAVQDRFGLIQIIHGNMRPQDRNAVISLLPARNHVGVPKRLKRLDRNFINRAFAFLQTQHSSLDIAGGAFAVTRLYHLVDRGTARKCQPPVKPKELMPETTRPNWMSALRAVWHQIDERNLGLIAAGVSALMRGLNTIHGTRNRSGIRHYVMALLLTFALIVIALNRLIKRGHRAGPYWPSCFGPQCRQHFRSIYRISEIITRFTAQSGRSSLSLSFRIAGLVLLIIGLPMGRIGLWVSALGGILAVCSFAQVGHIPITVPAFAHCRRVHGVYACRIDTCALENGLWSGNHHKGFAGRSPSWIGCGKQTSLHPKTSISAKRLKAEPVIQQILPEGDGQTSMLGFNGTMPGPELRVQRNVRVNIDVENGLDVGTAVHWHGIRLENKMDGVPMLTQHLIDPGDTKTYSFVPPDAGTYWYHSHHVSHEQGIWETSQRRSCHGIEVKTGDRVRFRLINAATNRIFPIVVSGIDGSVVALDGMALSEPRPLDELVLAPAQRVDLIADITGPVAFDMKTRQGEYRLADLAVRGENTDRQPSAIPTLAPPDLPAPADPSQHLTLTMMGGAMGGQHGGDNIWAFNDISDVQDAPFGSFARGETVKITLVNDTSFPHGIHLHGHHFYELGDDGSLGDLRDTTLVNAREKRDIVCVFDNPGRWLVHCHMLSHAVGGMRTWVNVAA
ncbi:Multicopper oxidase mco [Nymphon striatum]|nr:Multicopper oxidase mco [Nymphon striatum]